MRFALPFSLIALVLAPGLAACDSSSPDTPDAALSDDAPASLSDGAPIPATAVCTGDQTSCLFGTLKTSGFTAMFPYAEVQLYRVFPSGTAMPVDSQELATDGTFAFSGLAPWAHYYLRGVAQFGPPTAPVFIDTYQGRFAIPSTTPAPIALVIQPIVAGVGESEVAGTRSVTYATARVYDPATGIEVTDATVSLVVAAGETLPMTYGAPVGQVAAPSYLIDFSGSSEEVEMGPIQIQAAAPELGASPLSVTISNEASLFEATLTSPADGATIPLNQALPVTWPSQPIADYALVELFVQKTTSSTGAGSFVLDYESAGTIATDVTTDTIPATAIATAGKYLLNVDLGQAACGLDGSQGCAYLVHTAVANLTAQ
jgi:hypothetical protein